MTRRKRTKGSYKEQAIQAAAVRFMRLALPKRAVVFSVPNETSFGPAARAALITAGMVSKFPDVCISYDGLYILEFKKGPPPKKPSLHEMAQGVVQQQLRESGAKVAVVWSVEMVEEQLRAWELPLRATTGANLQTESRRQG